METFRLLTIDDIDAYYDVLHRGYQCIRQYPISFSAIDAPKDVVLHWLTVNPTYGLFEKNKLASAISLRMPWGPNPGPKIVPHIGWFVTNPDYKHRGYATKLLHEVEEQILRKELKTHLVTLGTAANHPWLKDMYEKMGFQCYDQVQLKNKKHITLYFQKKID